MLQGPLMSCWEERGLLWSGFSELQPFLLTLSWGRQECKSGAMRPETFFSFLSDAFCDTATSQHNICTVKPRKLPNFISFGLMFFRSLALC